MPAPKLTLTALFLLATGLSVPVFIFLTILSGDIAINRFPSRETPETSTFPDRIVDNSGPA